MFKLKHGRVSVRKLKVWGEKLQRPLPRAPSAGHCSLYTCNGNPSESKQPVLTPGHRSQDPENKPRGDGEVLRAPSLPEVPATFVLVSESPRHRPPDSSRVLPDVQAQGRPRRDPAPSRASLGLPAPPQLPKPSRGPGRSTDRHQGHTHPQTLQERASDQVPRPNPCRDNAF